MVLFFKKELLALPFLSCIAANAAPVLAVCADPDNLPYSNEKQEGFENKIAGLLAADLHQQLRYTWNEERRSFFRRTLFAGVCDVVISVPATLPNIAATRPYFTSSYVAVTRAANHLHFASFDDAWLRRARIGLQLIGVEGINTPPAMSLARRGITDRITGFPMWADDDVVDPQGRIIDAVARNSIDVALVWGPFGGYFARPYGSALRLEPVTRDAKLPGLAFAFPMAMGVRKTDLAFRDTLQAAIDRHRARIDQILRAYGVPPAAPPGPPAQAAALTR